MFEGILFQLELAAATQKLRHELENRMRLELSPEAFKEWKHEREVERRHQELCKSIERAGKSARPSGIGIFW
jgi:hypothetical protein